MAKPQNNNGSTSIKGKIWLATAVLAFFVCVFGIISYLIAAFLPSNILYAVLVPFFGAVLTVIVFGWWLSHEIIGPVEKLSLLAKSLERGVSSSLPKTSGSAETDELMTIMFRLSQQTQRLVNSMDEVAQGKLNAVNPGDNSDRITTTFQKLLTKVSESINAKSDLEKLQSAISHLSLEIASVRKNNLNIIITAEAEETKEISLTLAYLIEKFGDVVTQAKVSSLSSQKSSNELQRNIQTLIRQDESRIQEMNHAAITLKQVPQIVQKISDELSESALSASESIGKAKNGTEIAQANLNAVNQLRKQIHESIKRIQKLSESSEEIGKVAKTVEDLAKRTSLVALNASIQAAELNEHGEGFIAVSEEVENLSKRANDTNKNISSLNKTIQAEINQVESSLELTVSQAANLSKYAIETGNSIGELERYVTQFLKLQEKIASYTDENTEDTEKAYQTFVSSITETEKAIVILKESAKNITVINNSADVLKSSVEDFDSSSADRDQRSSYIQSAPPADQTISF